MSNSKGNLSTLLNYRFVKKKGSKLSHSNSNQSNGLSKDTSNSSDSQATIPYSSQNSFSSETDSQKTLPYDSQPTASSQGNNDLNSQSPPYTNTEASPVFKGKGASPVFKSKQNADSENISQLSTIQDSPASKPWISKTSGGPVHTVKPNANFKRIKRPQADSDSEDDDFGKGSGIKVDKEKLKKLSELFPGGDIKRMKAALFAYQKDFQKAIEFMKSTGSKTSPANLKRKLSENSDEELPEITGSRKRIRVNSETPSPTKKPGQDSLTFLKECFPGKSEQHIQKILNENDGDTERASVALTSEDSQDAKVAESFNHSLPRKESKLAKIVKAQKAKAVNGSSKRRDNDMSEDDDEEYGNEIDSGDSDDSEEFENRTSAEVTNILQFFEEATVEEISAMPGCSKKKSELIISLRPFQNWDTLCFKFNNEKSLSTSLISGCKEIMRVRNIIHRLMVRCESISQQMEKLVHTLSGESKDEELNVDGRLVKQPDLLDATLSLKPYQLIGLSWLRIMHEQELNGILADEMGLGKTVQAISFLAHLLEEGEAGPHVIIVPSSTIENWLRELQRWCPALKVIVYYGSQEERRAVRHSIFVDEEEFNVLLTTYNMATGGVEDRVLFKKFDFHYAIFDEGHMLKNMSSLRFQNLMKIAAERRLLLTGTPLQNNLLELMSLLCFVMPEIFQGKTDSLKKMFAMISRAEDKQKSRYEWEKIAQAKRIMKPFLLRRLKKDVLKQLPKKREQIYKCKLTEPQRTLYDGLISNYAQQMEKEKEDGAPGGGIGYFMQFRKAANHPLLLRNLYTDDILSQMAKKIAKEPSHRDRGALPKLIQEDMSLMNDFELIGLCRQYKKQVGKYELDSSIIAKSGKFEKLDELLPAMKERGDRVLLFSQFTMVLDIVELYLEQRQHKFIRLDGQTPVTDRLQLIDRYNNEPDIFIFLLSTRAGGLGINLTAANVIILHDIDFNPYNDKQAEDRCHRLGQKREVQVIRLICEDTVDESMLRCANEKLALEKDVTGSGAEEDNQESSKDVANLLKEVLKQHQKRSQKGLNEEVDQKNNDDMIEIRDDEDDSPGSDPTPGSMIEIGDDEDEVS